MRKIIPIIAGYQLDLSSYVDLSKIKIKSLWTLYDEKTMWDSCKFNPITGKSVETLDDLVLRHNQGVFIEDFIHDWNVNKGKLNYYSRVVGQGDEIKILIEYEEI